MKNAKDGIASCSPKKNLSIEPTPTIVSQITTVVEKCKRMVVVVVKCGKPQLMRSTLDLIDAQTKLLEDECISETSGYVYNKIFFEETILNPSRVRHKGCDNATVARSQGRNKNQRRRNDGVTRTNVDEINISQGRKTQSCGVCRTEGHNRASCLVLRQEIESENESYNEFDDDHALYGNIGTVEMVSQCLLLL
jgi:hypothetical protein